MRMRPGGARLGGRAPAGDGGSRQTGLWRFHAQWERTEFSGQPGAVGFPIAPLRAPQPRKATPMGRCPGLEWASPSGFAIKPELECRCVAKTSAASISWPRETSASDAWLCPDGVTMPRCHRPARKGFSRNRFAMLFRHSSTCRRSFAGLSAATIRGVNRIVADAGKIRSTTPGS